MQTGEPIACLPDASGIARTAPTSIADSKGIEELAAFLLLHNLIERNSVGLENAESVRCLFLLCWRQNARPLAAKILNPNTLGLSVDFSVRSGF